LGTEKMARGAATEAPFDPGRPPGGKNIYYQKNGTGKKILTTLKIKHFPKF
jgi:hypothetical protein